MQRLNIWITTIKNLIVEQDVITVIIMILLNVSNAMRGTILTIIIIVKNVCQDVYNVVIILHA